MSGRLQWCVPILLAVFFALWGLRGVLGGSIADDDAPRHALNGAFLLDMVRQHQVAHPVQYGYWYYSRLPALSLPYHPPIFPAFEALVYGVIGVNTLAARIAIAVATFAAVLLLYRVILRTHNSPLLATMVTISFFALPRVQKLSATVMLEVPALVFVLAALVFATPDEGAFQTPRSLMFAVFAAAAIWTKQTVFLFLFPFVYVIVARKWSLLRKSFFWITVVLVALSAIGLALLGREIEWNSINQSWAHISALQQLIQNSVYYFRWKIVVGLLVFAALFLTYRWPGGRDDLGRDRIYIAWFLAVLLVLMMAPAYSYRYLFFGFPPYLVILFNGISRTTQRFMPKRWWIVPALVACAVLAYGMTYPPVVLRGPTEAAEYLQEAGLHRILFCGNLSNGAFIFAVRSIDPRLSTIVIRGDKLPETVFSPDALNSLVRQYGVDSVVLEHTVEPQAWDALSPQRLPSLSEERVVTMTDSNHYRDGTLTIYRVKSPTHVPESSIQVPISVLCTDLDLRLKSLAPNC